MQENEGDSEVETEVRRLDEGEWSEATDQENSDDDG